MRTGPNIKNSCAGEGDYRREVQDKPAYVHHPCREYKENSRRVVEFRSVLQNGDRGEEENNWYNMDYRGSWRVIESQYQKQYQKKEGKGTAGGNSG